MKLVVGLGNPGVKYTNTRHNAGFLVVDALAPMANGRGLMVKKTNVSMNNSGEYVLKLINHYSLDINNLYIIHDDLDIPLGSYKIQYGRGPKDHNGIKSVNEALGTRDYYRVRVGIENRDPENKPSLASQGPGKISGEVYTLEDFTSEERKTLEHVIVKICKEISKLDSL